MSFLGVDALEWMVALDVGVLIASGSTAAALFVKLQKRERVRRLQARYDRADVGER